MFSRSYKYTDYREFACPICRKKTSIPTGGVHKLPDNFLIAGLSEMISQKSSGANGAVRISSNCEICKAVHDREREATSRCIECQKFLCRHCVQAHQTIAITREHSMYELEIEKDILCKVRDTHHSVDRSIDRFLLFSIIQRNSFVTIAIDVKCASVSRAPMPIIAITISRTFARLPRTTRRTSSSVSTVARRG